MPDEARDGRNVALKFLTDCWRARSSKAEFLHAQQMCGLLITLRAVITVSCHVILQPTVLLIIIIPTNYWMLCILCLSFVIHLPSARA